MRRDLLRSRSYRAYLTGAVVSAFGTRMAQVALPLALLGRGAGAGALGLVLGAAVLPKAVLLLAGGVAGDRMRRRTLLIGADLTMAAAQAATGLLLAAGAGAVWQLAALQLLYGCAGAFASPALTGLMPELVPVEHRHDANALLRAAISTAAILGPGAAGLVIVTAGAAWAVLADAVTFGASAVMMALLPRGRAAPSGRGGPLRRDLVEGWSAFAGTPWVWAMVASFAAYQATVLPALFVIGPGSTERIFGAGGWAALLTARSVGGLLGGLALLRWRPARPLVAALLLLLLDVPMLLLLSGAAGLPGLLAAATLSAAGATAADILWETSLQHHIRPDLLSRISSYDWMGSVLFAPLGFALIGAAAAAAGERDTLVAVVVTHVAVHLVLPAVPAIRGIGRRPVTAQLLEEPA